MFNVLTAPSGVTCSGAGDIINDGNVSYLYNAEGQICAVENSYEGMTGYIYDADGERVGKGAISEWSCDPSVNGFSAGTDYVRDQSGRQLSEIGPNGQGAMALVHANVYAAGALIATDDDTETHFYLTDWLGTRRVQTSYAGVVEQDCMSLPYGDSESCMPEPTENLYTGKERDTETAGGVSPFGANEGNDYFGARYYSSVMGIMLSPDPGNIGSDPSDPQSWNMYSYSSNNPLSNSDPTGMYTCDDNDHCSSQNDKAFAQDLTDARNAAFSYLSGADLLNAVNAVNSYGDANSDNGVSIDFKTGLTDSKGDQVGGLTSMNPSTSHITAQFDTKAINSSQVGPGLAAHEGTHVFDAVNFRNSGQNPSLDPSHYQTEMSAYQVQFNVTQANEQRFLSNNGMGVWFLTDGKKEYDVFPGETWKDFEPTIKMMLKNSSAYGYTEENNGGPAFPPKE